jgi:hypothetical protein
MPEMPENDFQVPIAVGRLDGDSIDDFVALGADPPILYGFSSEGGSFERNISIQPATSDFTEMEYEFPKVFLRDINDDGIDEIHLRIGANGIFKAYIFDHEGSPLTVFNQALQYLSADLNNDGTDEFYIYDNTDGCIKQLDIFGSVRAAFCGEIEGSPVLCRGLSAYDVDGDGYLELVMLALQTNESYWLYVFEDGLEVKAGWPRDLGISYFLAPTIPVFGDLDDDGIPEYVTTYFTISYGYVHIWNIDGSSFIPGSPDGLFCQTPRPAVINMPLLADMDGDLSPDIVACANDDLFSTYKVQRIYAWNSGARLLPDFPLITVPQVPYDYTSALRFVPTVGDIDRDGNVDMIMPTSDSCLIFINYPDCPYHQDKSPAPFWRYSRRLNNVGPTGDADVMSGVDITEKPLPLNPQIFQNSPNPFNASTSLTYYLPGPAHTEISIYNILGRLVRKLLDSRQSPGRHRVTWDGTDDEGLPVSSGIYFYRFKTDDFAGTKKMTLMK